jgi:hypothetical protein
MGERSLTPFGQNSTREDMLTIDDLSEWIRNYGHDARHLSRLIADEFVWHQLWTAMDVINDAESATVAYLDHEFPGDTGEQYLRIYGVMQALFLQQDALVDLIKAVHPSKNILPNDVLKDIREVRNASVGHPTRLERKGRKELSAHGIIHNTMTKNGFDLLSYPRPKDKVFTHVSVRDLIEKQRAETVRILSEVVNDLIEQEKAHRDKFRDIKLVKAFAQISYAFEKNSKRFAVIRVIFLAVGLLTTYRNHSMNLRSC